MRTCEMIFVVILTCARSSKNSASKDEIKSLLDEMLLQALRDQDISKEKIEKCRKILLNKRLLRNRSAGQIALTMPLETYADFLNHSDYSKLQMLTNNKRFQKSLKKYGLYEVAVPRLHGDVLILKNKNSQCVRFFSRKTKALLWENRELQENCREFLEEVSLKDYEFVVEEKAKYLIAKHKVNQEIKVFCTIWDCKFSTQTVEILQRILSSNDFDWAEAEFVFVQNYSLDWEVRFAYSIQSVKQITFHDIFAGTSVYEDICSTKTKTIPLRELEDHNLEWLMKNFYTDFELQNFLEQWKDL